MFKTLGALVLSMFAGASLLLSIEPGPTLSAKHPSVLLSAGGQPLAPPTTTRADMWRQVVVLCAADSRHKAVSGIGINTREEAHLTIDGAGRLLVNPAWFDGRRLEGFDNALVVCIELAPSAVTLAPAQVDTVYMLVARLRAELGFTRGQFRYESLHPAIESLDDHLGHAFPDSLTMND